MTVQDLRYDYDPVGNVTRLHTLPHTPNAPANFTLTDTVTTLNSATWTKSGNVASVAGAAMGDLG